MVACLEEVAPVALQPATQQVRLPPLQKLKIYHGGGVTVAAAAVVVGMPREVEAGQL